jgi:hypothetical protein
VSSNLTGGTNRKCWNVLIMKTNLKKIFCSHKDVFAYRRYNDFDFVEYQMCNNCGKILNMLQGFDEDIRG